MTEKLNKYIESFESENSDAIRWVAPILRWSIWVNEEANDVLPDVSFVESTLRRRLSSLAKISLKVAHDCADDLQHVHLVYASRHGDLNRTTQMLVDLAEDQPLSPTTFSMSVLNAFAGVYSIARQIQLPSTSISAGELSFGFGLLEACLQLASKPETPVLFVYADEPAPAIYRVLPSENFQPHAIAILLSNEATTKINCTMMPVEALNPIDTQSQSFIKCLNGKYKHWKS